MKGLRVFLATFAITLTLGALAADSVTPSRLRLLSLGVGTAPGSTNGNITASGTISGTHSGNGNALTNLNASNVSAGTLSDARLSGNVALLNNAVTFTQSASVQSIPSNGSTTLRSGSPSNTGYIEFHTPDGVRRGYIGFGSNTEVSIASDNGARFNFSNLAPKIMGKEVCLADGSNCPAQPRMAYARINGTTQCAYIGGASLGVVLPCNRTAAGSYTVDLSPAFAAVPVCTVSQHSNSARIMQVLPVSASQVYVRARDTTGALTDGDFSIICIGT